MRWFHDTYGDGEDARARFMADSGRHGFDAFTKGRVSQFFDENQPFGERAAKSIAQRLGLPEDFFLSGEEEAATLDPDILDLARQINDVVNNSPDPRRRQWAMQLMTLAATTDRPKTMEETFELARTLSRESLTI